ncbi:DHHC palmitoyltransferase-domain-containing protein [Tuber brumale]|nr:DHHC palmitoyltransferase-domain-containing protein [Tuber brumale]
MDSPISSPTMGPPRRGARFSCRQTDRLCCTLATYFPLLFVYSTLSWAVYTYSYSICWQNVGGMKGGALSFMGFALCALANWSYTTAVFTNPGSPMDTDKHAYSHLPTTETAYHSSITVKSSGQERFCKKCECRKPDRTHHCSSCRKCVLKMDHHCPWLSNCLGLYNYKAFLLFLIYTSVFSLLCFVVSCIYVYQELFSTGEKKYSPEDLTPVNWVLLAVVAGVVGLVLSGFTIWHLTLVASGMTTIESLEKVRYNSPTLSRRCPPPPEDAHHLYDDPNYQARQENIEAFQRYNTYIMEEASNNLPHAFHLGRGKNFQQVFGGKDQWMRWFIPVFSGIGDGWNWETSSEWKTAVETMKKERARLAREQGERERRAGWGCETPGSGGTWKGGNPNGLVKHATANGSAHLQQSKAERVLGRIPGSYSDHDMTGSGGERVPLRRMNKSSEEVDFSDDDDVDCNVDLEQGTQNTGTSWVSWGPGSAGTETNKGRWV